VHFDHDSLAVLTTFSNYDLILYTVNHFKPDGGSFLGEGDLKCKVTYVQVYIRYLFTKKEERAAAKKDKALPVSTCLEVPLQVDSQTQYRLRVLVYKALAFQRLPTGRAIKHVGV